MLGAHRPPRSALPEDMAEMISAWPMFLMVTSVLAMPHFFRQDCTAKSPVELAVSTIVWPLIEAGSLANLSAVALLASSALPADSSLVTPMVLMPKRTWPSTAGTPPVPPTSQDLDADAAICGTPAGKVENTGLRPISAHQPLTVATWNGSAQYSAGW